MSENGSSNSIENCNDSEAIVKAMSEFIQLIAKSTAHHLRETVADDDD